jgi:hypothetical protein
MNLSWRDGGFFAGGMATYGLGELIIKKLFFSKDKKKEEKKDEKKD